MKPAYDVLVKLIIIGDSGVGKTCVLLKFSDNNFTLSHISTIGIDFKIKTVEIEGKKVKMQIWDTAGQDRFQTITHTYYKGAMGVILAYDCTDEASFNHIRNWIKQIEQHANPNVMKVLIANKCDKPDKVVDQARGKSLADEYQMPFFETSAKDNTNIQEAFVSIAKEIMKRGDIISPAQNLVIKESPSKSKAGCC